jgi:hypothetical protein
VTRSARRRSGGEEHNVAEIAIDLRTEHRVEADSSHTITIELTGLPTLGMAQKVSDWMGELVRENGHQIGRLAAKPPRVQ